MTVAPVKTKTNIVTSNNLQFTNQGLQIYKSRLWAVSDEKLLVLFE